MNSPAETVVGGVRVWRAQPPSWVGAVLATPALVLVVVLVGYPLIAIIAATLGVDGRQALGDVLGSHSDRKALVRTIRVSAEVTALSLILGVLLAWALTTARTRIGRLVLWIAVLAPFWMSVVVKNYAFVLLLRQGGAAQETLATLGLVDSSTDLLYTEGAVVLGMLYAMLPYSVLPLYASFSRLDQSMISAAESLGANRMQAVLGVVGPLCARGILAAGTLVFVISLGFYVTPVILGGPTAPFAASAIGTALFEFFDLTGAKALAVILLGIALLAVIISQLIGRFVLTGADK